MAVLSVVESVVLLSEVKTIVSLSVVMVVSLDGMHVGLQEAVSQSLRRVLVVERSKYQSPMDCAMVTPLMAI